MILISKILDHITLHHVKSSRLGSVLVESTAKSSERIYKSSKFSGAAVMCDVGTLPRLIGFPESAGQRWQR